MKFKSIDDDMKYRKYNKRSYQTLKTLTNTSPRSTAIIEDNNGTPLADETKILNRWTEYCNYQYNHLINSDTTLLSNTAIFNDESDTELSILDNEIMDVSILCRKVYYLELITYQMN